MFKFSFSTVLLLLRPSLRQTNMLALLRSLFGYDQDDEPVGYIASEWELFVDYRDTTNKYLPYSEQTMCLEYILSQWRPPFIQADVTIEDGERTEPVYLHNNGESFDPLYLWNNEEDENPAFEYLYLMNNSEYEEEYDFIVRVHRDGVGTEYKENIASIVDQFKITGKKYIILGDDE